MDGYTILTVVLLTVTLTGTVTLTTGTLTVIRTVSPAVALMGAHG